MNFADQLVQEIERKGSRICVGLDPVFEKLPKEYAGAGDPAEAALDFNKRVIDSVKDHCVIVKPNLGFFLALGEGGWSSLKKTISYAKNKGLLTLVDGKVGDIGNTSQAYSYALYQHLACDATTVNPFHGSDSVKPFLDYCAKDNGLFLLCKTSNPSSVEFQALKTGGKKNLSDEIAAKITEWGETCVGERGYSSVGAVVGATSPEEASKLRNEMKKQFFLVPGYGAQGGDAQSVRNCFNKGGLGAIVSASRSVLYASSGKDFAEAAAREAEKMKDGINSSIGV